MLTIDSLKQWGANTEEGLQRCMNNESMYLRLVDMFLSNNSYNELKNDLANNDLDGAFQAAHALKGVLGNLSLTPLYVVICEVTELLRNRTQMDYSDYLKRYEMTLSLLQAIR